jgi:CubicO group peptidase (beta-lactamase class C family)
VTTDDGALVECLREYAPQALEATATPGLNIALGRGDDVLWEEGFGLADRVTGRAMSSATVTRAGSISKLYTAVAVMQLVEQGALGLHDQVRAHLPELPIVNPHGEREVTVYDLLTHRSGLMPNDGGCRLGAPPALADWLDDAYRAEHTGAYGGVLPRWSRKTGAEWQYSNLGIATLGRLVEVANPDGLEFCAYVNRHVIEPLGMTSTVFAPSADAEHLPADVIERVSVGYARFGRMLVASPTLQLAEYPAGSLLTTPGDHVRLLLMLMNGGTFGGHRVLRPTTVRLMLAPQAELPGVPHGAQGLVVRLSDRAGGSFGHAGAMMWGWWNEGRAYPERGLAGVVCANVWDMLGYFEPKHEEAQDLIFELLERWPGRAARPRPAPDSVAWRTSYLLGLMMVERLHGALGIGERLDEAAMETMAASPNDDRLWDADGFRAGAHDMLAVEPTVQEIGAALQDGRLRASLDDLRLRFRQLGGAGPLPVPAIRPEGTFQ